jgi:ubiquinone/menaquinone biosynthesis C-methylase UbiE
MNRRLGWSAGVWREVGALAPPPTAEATLLDVATGSADVPRTLAGWAAARGLRLRPIGSDISAAVLAEARRFGDDVALVRHDATALPFADASIDIVTLCLAAHHLDPAPLTRALAEMWRVARRGIVISDLERSPAAYIAARLMAVILRNPLTSHDGPVSVLRAYTAGELQRIARGAGLTRFRIHRRFPFRLTLVAKKAMGNGQWATVSSFPIAHCPLPIAAPPQGAPCPMSS